MARSPTVLEGFLAFNGALDGATYQFSSAKNQQLFKKNPEQYVPAYGGYCTFGVSVGKKLIGDSEVWRIVRA